MTALNEDVAPSDWQHSAIARLTAWAVAGMWLLMSPSTDHLVTDYGMVTAYQPLTLSASHEMGAAGALSDIGHDTILLMYAQAREEATIGLRLLHEFKSDVGLSEIDAYLRNVESILARLQERPSLPQVSAFTLGLQMARARLVADAQSIDTWSRVSRAIEPTARLRVPERFIRKRPVEEAPPLVISEAEINIDRSLDALVRRDANSAAAST